MIDANVGSELERSLIDYSGGGSFVFLGDPGF
jgi:hypothetical protein